MSERRRTHAETWLACLLVAGMAATTVAMVTTRDPDTQDGHRSARIVAGEEVVMVVVASSSCPWLDYPGLADAVHVLKEHLRARAEAEGKQFVTIGLAVDAFPAAGIEALDHFGPFDEIIAGRGWLNTGTLRYTWDSLPGPASEPQIIVLERRVATKPYISVSDERVRVRRSGAFAIIDWAKHVASPTDSTRAQPAVSM